jgi:hypothetical protein
MAGERLSYVPNEIRSIPESAKKQGKKVILFLAEKSIFVTAPITAAAVAAGAVTLGLGALMIGGDVIGSKWAGNERKKLQK